MALNWPWSNICTAHQLIILDNHAELFANKYKRYRPNKLKLKLWPWPLTDHGQTQALHIVSSYLTFVQNIWKSHKGFKRYRVDTKVWRTDGQTDNRAKNNISWGGDIIKVSHLKLLTYYQVLQTAMFLVKVSK